MIAIDLTDKTALITGAGQGLGASAAKTLHRAGARVVINYFNDSQGVNQALAQKVAGELGERSLVIAADVRDASQVQRMFDEATRRLGPIGIVVNNAGIIRDRTISKMSSDDWKAVIDTNLTGVFNVCKAAIVAMPDRGRIVNMASISAAIGFFGQTNYAAAKAGVIALTKVLSKELGKRGITVNAVAPGVVLTEMGKTIPEQVRSEMLKQIALARLGEPQEIADAVLFLCSDLASYVTGQTLHVNGGWWG